MANINRVTITGNLTRDPEMKATGGGTTICELGVAVNHSRKDNQTGQWVEEPNYFNVTVFGSQGDNCANYLSKGRPVAIDGRLRWSSWQNQDGDKRSKVDIVASTVQFLGSRGDAPAQGQQGGGGGGGFAPSNDVPADTSDFDAPVAAGGGGSDDDIPF